MADKQATVGILVDYEGSLARRVAGGIWSGLSRAALNGGYAKTTAQWESLKEPRSLEKVEGAEVCIFVVEQSLPEAVDYVEATGSHSLYGFVVAVPEPPSFLAGPLLDQGLDRLAAGGVKAGAVESALLPDTPEECSLYARRLLGRLQKV